MPSMTRAGDGASKEGGPEVLPRHDGTSSSRGSAIPSLSPPRPTPPAQKGHTASIREALGLSPFPSRHTAGTQCSHARAHSVPEAVPSPPVGKRQQVHSASLPLPFPGNKLAELQAHPALPPDDPSPDQSWPNSTQRAPQQGKMALPLQSPCQARLCKSDPLAGDRVSVQRASSADVKSASGGRHGDRSADARPFCLPQSSLPPTQVELETHETLEDGMLLPTQLDIEVCNHSGAHQHPILQNTVCAASQAQEAPVNVQPAAGQVGQPQSQTSGAKAWHLHDGLCIDSSHGAYDLGARSAPALSDIIRHSAAVQAPVLVQDTTGPLQERAGSAPCLRVVAPKCTHAAAMPASPKQGPAIAGEAARPAAVVGMPKSAAAAFSSHAEAIASAPHRPGLELPGSHPASCGEPNTSCMGVPPSHADEEDIGPHAAPSGCHVARCCEPLEIGQAPCNTPPVMLMTATSLLGAQVMSVLPTGPAMAEEQAATKSCISPAAFRHQSGNVRSSS